MKLDRPALLLLIAFECARLGTPHPLLLDGLTLLIWMRMYTAFHPRFLAETLRAHTSGRL